MKKIVSLIMVFAMMLSACLVFTSCGDEEPETYYVATADFFYSEDKGHTYGNSTKEYEIGETVYFRVRAKVTTNKDVPETIKMKLTIPNITAVDAKYYDGQPITPTYDSVQNVTTYDFTISASSNAQEWDFIFQFIPNAEAEVKMTLEFDDKIDAMYDKQNTVKFIAAERNADGE